MADVTKYSVYDPRIVQTKPEYAVEKGALSLTNVSFQAQTADSSSVQFNVQVPSENVFVDRAIEMTGTLVGVVTLTVTNSLPSGTSLAGLIGPAAFPIHQATTQMSATINDATVTVNTQDVLPQVLRLADLRDARRQRTCPTMLDNYAKYPDSRVVKNSPLLAWDETKHSDAVPNGGFNGFYFATDASGGTPQPLSGAGTTVGNVSYYNGQPYANSVLASGTVLTFYVAVTSTEKLLLPPFIFADERELSTGLFGVQNFQVQMNITPSSSCRSFRVSSETTFVDPADGLVTPTAIAYTSFALSTTAGNGCWAGRPTLAVQFLTPALDIPLPPKSIVPYMEFPRYIATPNTSVSQTGNSYTTTQLQSQTITLPNIPDLLLIYVKPSSYGGSPSALSQGDWSLPITQISLNFDNFSGLLSTITQDQLYQMSVRNGLDMDFSEWSGSGRVPLVIDSALAKRSGGLVGLVGGPLVLRPGRDFALQAGQASGLVGNFTLQFNLQVQNFTGITLDGSSAAQPFVNIYTVPISSGFFETIKGSSRIIKGVLTEQDILSAPMQAPSAALHRAVGGNLQAEISRQLPTSNVVRATRVGNAHGMKSYM